MFLKFRNFCNEKKPYLHNFTQPNMAFTPREIIEQFASGELIAQENRETDDFYDDKFSDDDLAAVVQTDDEFTARQFVLDFQLEQEERSSTNNDSQASTNIRNGAATASAPAAEPVSHGDGSSNSLDGQQASS